MKLSSTLRRIEATLQKQHFAGLDQNPSGIMDLIGHSVVQAEKMERALSAQRHPNGARIWADDGTLLSASGHRSIFDDIDEGGDV